MNEEIKENLTKLSESAYHGLAQINRLRAIVSDAGEKDLSKYAARFQQILVEEKEWEEMLVELGNEMSK